MPKTLTDADKDLILKAGGIPVGGNWGGVIRFEKCNKPSPSIKNLLRECGYKVTNRSGSKFYCFIDFKLTEQNQ